MLIDYADKEWKGEKHVGETPVQIIKEVQLHGDKAVQAIEAAAKNITRNAAEFNRLKNDMYCYRALADHYAQKAEAALSVLRYKYSNDIKDLEKALPVLEKSVISYKRLVDLTKGTYLYANSMQTQQRKIPIRGSNGTFKTWQEVLVPFENELNHFRKEIDSLKNSPVTSPKKVTPLTNAIVTFTGITPRYYTIDSLSSPFTDTAVYIKVYAKELSGLKGLQLPFQQQLKEGTTIQFSSTKPVKILVGYFNPPRAAAFTAKDTTFVKAPELETNASANEYGQSEIRIANAMEINGMPPVNIHVYSFAAGSNTLKLAKGVCLILGFVDGDQAIPLYDAGITASGMKKEIDWLFE